MVRLDELSPTPGSRKERKRVGRGNASHGTYSGRGGKGQTARSGYQMPPAFEGGQTPLWKRVPKRGFQNFRRRIFSYVNLDDIAEQFEEGAEVTPEELLKRHLIKEIRDGVKVLGRGRLTKRLILKAHSFSKKARQQIEEAGGQAIVLKSPRRAASRNARSGREGDG